MIEQEVGYGPSDEDYCSTGFDVIIEEKPAIIELRRAEKIKSLKVKTLSDYDYCVGEFVSFLDAKAHRSGKVIVDRTALTRDADDAIRDVAGLYKNVQPIYNPPSVKQKYKTAKDPGIVARDEGKGYHFSFVHPTGNKDWFKTYTDPHYYALKVAFQLCNGEREFEGREYVEIVPPSSDGRHYFSDFVLEKALDSEAPNDIKYAPVKAGIDRDRSWQTRRGIIKDDLKTFKWIEDAYPSTEYFTLSVFGRALCRHYFKSE